MSLVFCMFLLDESPRVQHTIEVHEHLYSHVMENNFSLTQRSECRPMSSDVHVSRFHSHTPAHLLQKKVYERLSGSFITGANNILISIITKTF